jgi:hypothetical protein
MRVLVGVMSTRFSNECMNVVFTGTFTRRIGWNNSTKTGGGSMMIGMVFLFFEIVGSIV